MIYSILLYLIFILPFSLFNYKKDGNKFLFIKILNSLVTLYLFVLVSDNCRILFHAISDESFLLMKKVPFSLNLTISILYFILCFITGIQIIKLAVRKGNSRVTFLILVPFLFAFTGVQKYYVYCSIYNENPPLNYLIFSNFISALVWLGIIFLYNSKGFKLFFSSNETIKS
jgi:hypothetical protein